MGYPNHYEMKKKRLVKLHQHNFICEMCGGEGKYVHHIDGSKDNHELSNLKVVCRKCHISLHKEKHGRPKKYDLKGLSVQYGLSIGAIYKRIKSGIPLDIPRRNKWTRDKYSLSISKKT